MKVTMGNSKVGSIVPGKSSLNVFETVTDTFQELIFKNEKMDLFFHIFCDL